MAFPPRFPPMQFGFQPQIYFNPVLSRGFNPSQPVQPPAKSAPVTTVFVGNISEKCTNEFMQQMLKECGPVANWKRIQGSNHKFQAFGFCDYENPQGTLRALRVLNEFQIGDKKLVVKVEEKVREEIRKWAIQHRVDEGKPELKLKDGDLPADEDDLKKDEEVRLKILNWIETDHPQLLVVTEDGELSDKEGKSKDKTAKDKNGVDKEVRRDRDEKDDRRKQRSRSRSDSRSKSRTERRRSRSPRNKRRRRHSSSSSRSSRSSSSSSSGSSRSRSRSRTPKKRRRSSSRYSVDSEEARERKALKKQIKEKESQYMARLKKWEAREKLHAKQYEREERKEKESKKNALKEAKKLKHFLEDYDDEKDDPKYYKSSNLFQRKRDYEKELEADSKDRLREQQEIEELKKQILAEGKTNEESEADEEARKRHREQEDAALRRLRGDSGSPNPHQPLGRREGDESSSSSGESDDDEKAENDKDNESSLKEDFSSTTTPTASNHAPVVDKWKTIEPTTRASPANGSPAVPVSVFKPTTTSASVSSPTTANAPVKRDLTQRLNGVFGMDDDDEVAIRKKKLRPFEITEEDRRSHMTPEERKKLMQDLVTKIPTAKEQLFLYPVDWNSVDNTIMEKVKRWVTKKVSDYIGEEEMPLVDFICEKISARTPPDRILSDIAMILDDDAEVFVVKMWRLLIYESEAKKRGISKAE